MIALGFLKELKEDIKNNKEKHAIMFFSLGIFSGVILHLWLIAVAFFVITAIILRSLWVFVCIVIVLAALSYFGIIDLNAIADSIKTAIVR